MIAGSAFCSSFKLQLLLGAMAFGKDDFYMALYNATANLDTDTEAYTPYGEILGPGYTARGQLLTGVEILGPVACTVYITWNDAIWPNSSLTACGALIYNHSQADSAVAVLNFGTDWTSNDGAFHVMFPPPGASTALLRLS